MFHGGNGGVWVAQLSLLSLNCVILSEFLDETSHSGSWYLETLWYRELRNPPSTEWGDDNIPWGAKSPWENLDTNYNFKRGLIFFSSSAYMWATNSALVGLILLLLMLFFSHRSSVKSCGSSLRTAMCRDDFNRILKGALQHLISSWYKLPSSTICIANSYPAAWWYVVLTVHSQNKSQLWTTGPKIGYIVTKKDDMKVQTTALGYLSTVKCTTLHLHLKENIILLRLRNETSWGDG